MTIPRRQQVSLEATPFYHCVSRCVRRAFLCGADCFTGRSYEHRRGMIQNEAIRLASIFHIDIAAMAIMSNHYHLVLHVDKKRNVDAEPLDIAKRWHQLFKGTDVSARYIRGEQIEPHEQIQLDTLVDIWRTRLHSISWFMKALNEKIAKEANKEDKCSGHFWQARFKSQALLDEKAILSCMCYVDLNPIRATMALTPEDSDYTSIQLRIRHWKSKTTNHTGKTPVPDKEDLQPQSLMRFAGDLRQHMPDGIHFNLVDYLELVDWTGRLIRVDKRGAISETAPPILSRLNISPAHWLELTTHFEDRFKGIVGSTHSLKSLCSKFGLTRKTNFANSKLLFG